MEGMPTLSNGGWGFFTGEIDEKRSPDGADMLTQSKYTNVPPTYVQNGRHEQPRGANVRPTLSQQHQRGHTPPQPQRANASTISYIYIPTSAKIGRRWANIRPPSPTRPNYAPHRNYKATHVNGRPTYAEICQHTTNIQPT